MECSIKEQTTSTESIIPIARAEFTIAPLLQVPPASRGEPRTGSVPPARRGNLKEGVLVYPYFCELWLGDWYYTNRAFRVYELPPSFRFPPLREGNREGRAYSVPPASRGNLKEGVINCCFL
jgi:hypothetical protein